jgi:hypothetical protein
VKEMPVPGGCWIAHAITRLVEEAPAFCVFNGIRLEAEVGVTEDSVWEQWTTKTQKRAKENEEKEAAEKAKRSANWIWAIRRNERLRVLQRIRELSHLSIDQIIQRIEKEKVSDDAPDT